MEHGSNKAGPLHDDELAKEVRGEVQGGHSPRVEEWREPEPPGDDQPDAAEIEDADETVPAAPPGMSSGDVAGRSRLASYLDQSAFPADRSRLLEVAGGNNAPDDVLAELRRLPAGQTHQHVSDVWQALGHHVEDDSQRF
jgi:hypothetical protein